MKHNKIKVKVKVIFTHFFTKTCPELPFSSTIPIDMIFRETES